MIQSFSFSTWGLLRSHRTFLAPWPLEDSKVLYVLMWNFVCTPYEPLTKGAKNQATTKRSENQASGNNDITHACIQSMSYPSDTNYHFIVPLGANLIWIRTWDLVPNFIVSDLVRECRSLLKGYLSKRCLWPERFHLWYINWSVTMKWRERSGIIRVSDSKLCKFILLDKGNAKGMSWTKSKLRKPFDSIFLSLRSSLNKQ